MSALRLSRLGHTWIIDLDGTLLRHNGYQQGGDTLLPGAKEFLDSIPDEDMIILLTSRNKDVSSLTETFLREQGVRFDHIIYEAPYGERLLLNDDKPSGLSCAYALRGKRDQFDFPRIEIDGSL